MENGGFGRLEIKDCGDSKEGFLLMSGASKVRPMTLADSEARSVLGPTGNKEQRSSSIWKPVAKPLRKVDILPEDVSLEADNKPLLSPTAVASSSPPMHSMSVSSILHRQGSLLHSSLSLSASCSSDASSDSFHSRASTGRTYRTSSSTIRRRQLVSKPKVLVDSVSACSLDGLQSKKRCAWVTPSTGEFLFLYLCSTVIDLADFYAPYFACVLLIDV